MGDQDGTDDIQNNTDETSWKKGDKRCFISCQIVKKYEMRVGCFLGRPHAVQSYFLSCTSDKYVLN